MFPKQKFIFRTNLSSEKVKSRINRLTGLITKDNTFKSKESFNPIYNSPIFGNLALISGSIEEGSTETIIKVNVKLHLLGKIVILIGLFFGIAGLLLAIIISDFSQLLGIVPLAVFYPGILCSFYIDSGGKIKHLKKSLEILNANILKDRQ